MELKSLLAGLGLSILAAGSPQNAVPNEQVNKPVQTAACEDDYGFDSLNVNIMYEHYCKHKSREEGIKDLIRLTRIAKKEEMWLYVECLDGEKFWQEIGIWETFTGVYVDYGAVDKVLNHKISRLEPFHQHPIDEKGFDLAQTFSTADLAVCKQIMDYVDDRLPGTADLMSCGTVVSTGYYTLKIDSKVLYDIAARREFFAFLREMYDETNPKNPNKFEGFDYDVSNRRNFVKLNHKFCEKYSGDLIKTSFEEMYE